jgi:hypothetical protein
MSSSKRGAKKTAKKGTAKNGTAKKKAMRATAALAEPMPRREDIEGITRELPDISDWREAARVLKIRPFYTGPGSHPFSCLTATQMRMDPPRKINGVMYQSVNDFRLAEQCLQQARLHFHQ